MLVLILVLFLFRIAEVFSVEYITCKNLVYMSKTTAPFQKLQSNLTYYVYQSLILLC